MFSIIKRDKKTKARLGILSTRHGDIRTPSYVMVATHARIKGIGPADISKTKTQAVIANTYHLWDRILKDRTKNKNWVHEQLGRKMPVMTDSGGFQVFSLGFGHENKVGKILSDNARKIRNIRRKNIRITEKGVYFTLDGRKRFLGPELSIRLQEKIGADMIFAFDECTSPLDNLAYNKKAMARTHRWARTCLAARKRTDQLMFGIVQGGTYRSLRIQSARFIGSLAFEGIGIGGSFGKDEMVKTLGWVIPHLPEEKPRHLLGIGRVEDVFHAVENGIDLFDCVIPTREARHGRLWTKTGPIDIRKGKYGNDNHVIEKGCGCPVCSKRTARGYIRALFKDSATKRLAGQRLATLHNIWFFNNLLEEIRAALSRGSYTAYKHKFFKKFKRR